MYKARITKNTSSPATTQRQAQTQGAERPAVPVLKPAASPGLIQRVVKAKLNDETTTTDYSNLADICKKFSIKEA